MLALICSGSAIFYATIRRKKCQKSKRKTRKGKETKKLFLNKRVPQMGQYLKSLRMYGIIKVKHHLLKWIVCKYVNTGSVFR
jgi:hypothetical protein